MYQIYKNVKSLHVGTSVTPNNFQPSNNAASNVKDKVSWPIEDTVSNSPTVNVIEPFVDVKKCASPLLRARHALAANSDQ